MPRKRKYEDDGEMTISVNGGPEVDAKPLLQGAELRGYVDRLVRLHEEADGIKEFIKGVLTEAGSKGHNKRALAILVKRAMEDADERAAREALEQELALMEAQLGILAGTDLGRAAMDRAGAHGNA